MTAILSQRRPVEKVIQGFTGECELNGSSNAWLAWSGLFLLLTAVKGLTLLIDATPMFFMGDSGSYLYTAFTDWVPPDRSYLYGQLLGKLFEFSPELVSVVVVQTMLGACVAFVLALILHRHLGVRMHVAMLVALLFSVEPLQFTYERFILTETVSLFFAALCMLISCEALRQRRWLPGVLLMFCCLPFAGLAVLTRATFFPVLALWLGAICAGVCVQSYQRNRLPFSFWVPAMLLACGLLAFFNITIEAKASQSQHDGFFWVAAAAPLLKKEHFDAAGLDMADFRSMPCDLSDRDRREMQRWYPGCLVSQIQSMTGDSDEASQVSKQLAFHAIADRPAAFLHQGLLVYADYWHQSKLREAVKWDTGQRPLKPSFIADMQSRFAMDYNGYESLKTASRRYLDSALGWLSTLTLTPLICLLWLSFANAGQQRWIAFAMSVTTLAYLGLICLVSTKTVARYLHPLSFWFCMAVTALLAQCFRSRLLTGRG